MMTPPITDGVQEYSLKCWKGFYDLNDEVFAKGPAYIYRGQANWEWPIVSTFTRLQNKYPKRKKLSGGAPKYFEGPPLSEENHLKAFQRAIRGRRGENPSGLDDDSCWALGQHHGLATPLLDWTRLPYIALFFAFEEDKVFLNNDGFAEPKYRSVYALSSTIFQDNNAQTQGILRLVSPNNDDNYRLISQGGLLVKLPVSEDLESCIAKHFRGQSRQAVLIKFKILNSANDRNACLAFVKK